MGALGSKENLGQMVVIYGYNANDFAWRQTDNRSVYQTTGLIINYHNKKYVLTTRDRFIGCKRIVMYHSYFTATDSVMRNNLHILFQSIEHNIIILGTKKRDELDLTMSKILHGYHDPQIVCPSYNIANQNNFIVPTKRSSYYTVRMDMDLKSEKINYYVHIYDVKFLGSIIYDKTFVPSNYVYEFSVTSKKYDLHGIHGAVIFNRKLQPVGLISKTEENKLFVIPTKSLSKIVTDFINYSNKPEKYHGPICMPFTYEISKKSVLVVKSKPEVFNIPPKTNDSFVAINGNIIAINNKIATVFDNDFKEYIPLDIYLKLNIENILTAELSFVRRKKTITSKIIDDQYFNKLELGIPLTDQPYFYPICAIPYKIIGGLVVVQLTHEILDITMRAKIILKNDTIDHFLDGLIDNIENMIIVIDCLNALLAKTYDLPQFIPNKKKQTIKCHTLVAVNGKKVFTLSDLNESEIELTQSECLVITLESPRKKQYELVLGSAPLKSM